jgi:hypothetical protein
MVISGRPSSSLCQSPIENLSPGRQLRAITHRRSHPVIDTSFHLGELSAALAHLERPAHLGKVTISFADA